MKKIRLDLDMLSVESFRTTDDGADARGTVQAHLPRETEGRECESDQVCTRWYCEPCTCVTDCGTCVATQCGTCYDPSCGYTYCGTCETECGGNTCDPYCCCSCSCC